MRKLLFISIVLLAQSNCKTEKCQCDLSQEKLELINSQISKVKLAIGFHDAEQIIYKDPKIDKTYTLDVGNPFFKYGKSYKLVKSTETPYLETNLTEKYVDNKRTKHKSLSKKKFNLSSQEWNVIENTIESNCFWTSNVFPQKEPTEEVLIYSLEGIDFNSNICTNNYYHRITRSSRNQTDIYNLIANLITIEPLTDLDSLVNHEIEDKSRL